MHANGGALPYCYSTEKGERSIFVVHMYSQVALKWEEGRTEARKTQSGALSFMKAANLIYLTALAEGFERVWVCSVH